MNLSFSGHRPDKIANFTPATEQTIRQALNTELRKAYAAGYRRFLSGMAPGFDLWAADEVLKMRAESGYEEAELMAVVPYPAFSRSFDAQAKQLYNNAIAQASETIFIADSYHHAVFSQRNDYLVEHSSMLLCYYEGTAGGTRYTVKKAARLGRPIINIHLPELF